MHVRTNVKILLSIRGQPPLVYEAVGQTTGRVQTGIIGQDSDILDVLRNSVHVLAGAGEMSDLTACGVNPEINWIWQSKVWWALLSAMGSSLHEQRCVSFVTRMA